MNPIRWWVACAFGRRPLIRGVDRVDAWALIVGFVAIVAAVFPAVAVGEVGYTARVHEIAADAAAHHPVEAIALTDSTADPNQVESGSTSFLAHVRWTAQDIAHDGVTKVEQPVKAGQPVRIWLNDDGKVTTPPLTDTDAHVDAVGTVALVWLVFAAVIGVALATLRTVLGRSRDRGWDRDLRALVDDGGGSAAQRP